MKTELNHRIQEAINFVGRRGIAYATNSASEEEKKYFLGILYNEKGALKKAFISEIASCAKSA